MAPKDSVELHNVPLVITVAQKKRQDTGELGNVIKGIPHNQFLVTALQAMGLEVMDTAEGTKIRPSI